MAKHFIISAERTACGRTINVATGTADKKEVTCKTCCNTDAFNSASLPASVSPPPARVDNKGSEPQAVAVTRLGEANPTESSSTQAAGVAFDEWRNRLSCNDRLPRGKYFYRQRPTRSSSQSRLLNRAA